MLWAAVGCYWTWRSVDAMLYINRKIRLGYKESSQWHFAEAAACEGPVLWFSFFVTIFPFLYVVVACALGCWRLNRTNEEGNNSHGVEGGGKEGVRGKEEEQSV